VKLSNKGRYGVRAIFDIAFHNDGEPTQIRTIAERQGIPPRFLEQIFQDLKRAGLVTSKRGPRGGYALAKPPTEVRVGDVIRALEGPVVLASPKTDRRRTGDGSRAIVDDALEELAGEVEACFDALTIHDLCQRGTQGGVRRGPPRRYVYSI